MTPPKPTRPVRFLLPGLFGILLLFSLFLVYGSLPNRWYRLLVITSGSMFPAIQPGDLVLITPPPSVLKPGMILTLAVDGGLVTHRLVGFGEYGQLVTRGDANPVEDDWGDAPLQVAGLFRARIPRLGYLAALPGRISSGFVPSGAWFEQSEFISGEIGASSGWVTPPGTPDVCELRGNLTVVPYHEKGEFGIDLRLCLENTGQAPIDLLAISNIIETGPEWGELAEAISQLLDISAHPTLAPGEEYCYTARIPLHLHPGGKIRDRVEVYTILKPEQRGLRSSSQADPVAKILDLQVEFTWPETFPAEQTLTPQSATPAPEVSAPLPPTWVPLPSSTPPPTAVSPAPAVTPTPTGPPAPSPTSTSNGVPAGLATPTSAPPPSLPPPELPSSTPAGGAGLPLPTPTPAQADIPPLPEISPTPVPPSSTPEFLPTPARRDVCVQPRRYWLDHPWAWSVERLELGDQEIGRQEALGILERTPQDEPGVELAQAVLVAMLNAYQGADWSGIADELLAAQTWFQGHPWDAPLTAPQAEQVKSLYWRLDEFNQGKLGSRACPIPSSSTPLPTLSPSPTATQTAPPPAPSSTPTPAPAPTATAPEPVLSLTPLATITVPAPTPTAPPTAEVLPPTATPPPPAPVEPTPTSGPPAPTESVSAPEPAG